MQSAAIERLHCCLKPLVEIGRTAEQCCVRYPAVVENHVAYMRTLLTHLAILRPERNPWRSGVDQKRRDPSRITTLPISTRKHGEQLCLRCVRDEALCPVDDIAAAFRLSMGGQRACIGSGVGLRQCKGADDLATRHLR